MFTSGRMASFTIARGYLGAIVQHSPSALTLRIAACRRCACGTHQCGTHRHAGQETPDKDAAWELLKFINSSRGQTLKISTGYAYPSRRSVVKEDWYVNFKCGEAIGTGLNTVFNDIMENGWARTWPQHVQWPEINTVINSQLDALYSGDKSAEEVGTEIAAQVNAILSAE